MPSHTVKHKCLATAIRGGTTSIQGRDDFSARTFTDKFKTTLNIYIHSISN